MGLIVKYYLCTYIRESIMQYQNAYEVTDYFDELYGWADYAHQIFGLPDTLMDAFWEIDEDIYLRLTMQRYSLHFRRMVEYVIFLMSQKRLLPDLGDLHPIHNIDSPDWDDITSLSYSRDANRSNHCQKFICTLFRMSGWSIVKTEGRMYARQNGMMVADVPYYEDGDIYWERIYLDASKSNMDMYVFTSAAIYSRDEVLNIFGRFCESGSLYMVNGSKIIVVVELVTCEGKTSRNNDWSEFSPLSGLEAWCCHLSRQVFIPVIERKEE